jgi:hypothetical protein
VISEAHFFLAVFAGNPCRPRAATDRARGYICLEASNTAASYRREAEIRRECQPARQIEIAGLALSFVSSGMKLDRHRTVMQTSCRIFRIPDHDADHKRVIGVDVPSKGEAGVTR